MNGFPLPSRNDTKQMPSAAPKPMPGVGTRLTTGTLGYSYSSLRGEGTYAHPFKASLSGWWLSLALGLVENREPTLGGVPISGRGSKGPAPRLRLEAKAANKRGESWICVEAAPNAEGFITGESRLEIVHTAEPSSIDPTLARAPLCIVLWQDQRPRRVLAIVHFNLRYARVQPPPGGGPARHIFY